MGAAIRHAGCELERIPARVQMMVILGDGFPNDVDYKGTYAAADTRQALYELRARNIHTHGITVNLPAAPQLDQIYGDMRHSILSDVRDLPERLLQIYNTLTRH
jgi:nitric oxide reductase activation protein